MPESRAPQIGTLPAQKTTDKATPRFFMMKARSPGWFVLDSSNMERLLTHEGDASHGSVTNPQHNMGLRREQQLPSSKRG
jgi:hypothetical protein